MNIPRDQIPSEDKWNVESLFPTLEDWQNAFNDCVRSERPRWPEFQKFQGKLGESVTTFKSAIEAYFQIERQLVKVFTYAHLRHNEDLANEKNKIAYNQALSAYYDLQQEASWLQPEILALDEQTIDKYLNAPELKEIRFDLEKIIRLKPHMLSPEQEELLALAGKALSSSQKSFYAINEADFKFGSALDQNGDSHEVTHASYGVYLQKYDRVLRKNTFEQLHSRYLDYENTICEMFHGHFQSHLFNARARGYSSCVEAALDGNHIPTSVYHTLVDTVNANLDVHHRYIQLREKIMGVSPIALYDMYVPLSEDVNIEMDYHEAEDLIIESVAPLGAEYQNTLRDGLKQQRWVDRYENQGKKSGAFSGGCYDSYPYILMNYKGILRDVFTLAHEAGHSMHSFLSNQNQPYHYSEYPIYLAEVASTFNEDLLMNLMLERAGSTEEKIYLINQKIDDIRATFFRQTMFAEFELKMHTMVEEGIPLVPGLVRKEYTELNKKYFGENFDVGAEASIEWARIPHFYSNFYVYQYATGISAALALSEKVTKGGDKEREDYLGFLKSGCCRYPIDILKGAGIDMSTPDPIVTTLKTFESLVNELDQLMATA